MEKNNENKELVRNYVDLCVNKIIDALLKQNESAAKSLPKKDIYNAYDYIRADMVSELLEAIDNVEERWSTVMQKNRKILWCGIYYDQTE